MIVIHTNTPKSYNCRLYHFIYGILIFLFFSTSFIVYSGIADYLRVSKLLSFIITNSIFFSIFFYELIRKRNFIKLNRLDFYLYTSLLISVLITFFNDGYFFTEKNIVQLNFAFFYFVISNLYLSKYIIRNVIIGIIIVFLIQVTIAVLQYLQILRSFNIYFQITGFFNNPAPFSIYLSCLTMWPVIILIFSKKNHLNYCIAPLLILAVSIIFLIECRSAWVGLIVSVSVLILYKDELLKKIITAFKKNKKISLCVSLLFLITVFLFCQFLYHLKPASILGRLLVWKIDINVIRHNPFIGIGNGNFPVNYLLYQNKYFIDNPGRISRQGELAGQVIYTFNIILKILSESGLVGLGIFSMIIYSVIRIITRYKKAKELHINLFFYCSIATIIVILVSSLFSYPLAVLPVQVLFYFSIGILSAIDKRQEKTEKKTFLLGAPFNNIALIFVGSISLMMLFYAYTDFMTYKKWQQIEQQIYQSRKKSIAFANKMDKLYPILKDNGVYLIRLGELYMQSQNYKKAILIFKNATVLTSSKYLYYDLGNAYMQIGDYVSAIKCYKFICNAIPNLIMPRYLIAISYYRSHQKTKWFKQAISILEFKPKIDSKLAEKIKDKINSMYVESLKCDCLPEKKF